MTTEVKENLERKMYSKILEKVDLNSLNLDEEEDGEVEIDEKEFNKILGKDVN